MPWATYLLPEIHGLRKIPCLGTSKSPLTERLHETSYLGASWNPYVRSPMQRPLPRSIAKPILWELYKGPRLGCRMCRYAQNSHACKPNPHGFGGYILKKIFFLRRIQCNVQIYMENHFPNVHPHKNGDLFRRKKNVFLFFPLQFERNVQICTEKKCLPTPDGVGVVGGVN